MFKKILVGFYIAALLPNTVIKAQSLLLYNDFETGTIDNVWYLWAGDNSAIGIDSTEGLSGKYSVKVTGNKAYIGRKVSVEPNKTYKISAVLKSTVGQAIYFGAKDYQGDDAWVLSSDTVAISDSLFFTTGANATFATIYLWKEDGTGSSWVDNISLSTDTIGFVPEQLGGKGNYYVSTLGNDSNSGISVAQAWKTIEKVNSINFEPGDTIRFEGGQEFLGSLLFKLSDAGSNMHNVCITSYENTRAIIHAGNATGCSVLSSNNISIQNIDFKGNGRLQGNTGNGINISNCSNITIDSTDISGFQHSGVKVGSTGKNISVKHANTHDNGYAGIYITGTSGDKSSISTVYIGYCNAINNAGDPSVKDNHSGNGILAFNVSDVVIEYCTASENGWDMPRIGNGPGGIWVAEVDKATIQYCIAHDNKTPSGASDGLGFDLDGGTTNSVIQYCLSYNNYGSGFAVCQYPNATTWKNNTIRYCISQNDGTQSTKAAVTIWNGDNNTDKEFNFNFYNNTIYNEKGAALRFYDHYNKNFCFRNNIFVSKDTCVFNKIQNEIFQANCWYSLNGAFVMPGYNDFDSWVQSTGKEKYDNLVVGYNVNPVLSSPGTISSTDPSAMMNDSNYHLQISSLLGDAGLDLSKYFGIETGSNDFFGNAIPFGRSTDIGAYESLTDKTSVKNKTLESQWIQVFPNPSYGTELSIKISNGEQLVNPAIALVDGNGKTIISKRIEKNNQWQRIELNGTVASGLYFIRLNAQNSKPQFSKIVIY